MPGLLIIASLLIDRVDLVVDGEPVFESQIARRTEDLGDRDQAIAALVDEALLLAEARQLRLTVDDDEIDRALEAVELANGIDDAGLEAALTAQHWTMADYREDVARQLLVIRAGNVVVSTEAPRGTLGDRDATAEFLAAWTTHARAHAFIERRDPEK